MARIQGGLPAHDDQRYERGFHAAAQYHEYRRRGLPITSSAIESTVKQINRRIKGTEKFWDEGADPMLRLVADRLSQTHTVTDFWSRRTQRLINSGCYHQGA